jgi:hypothetical protein
VCSTSSILRDPARASAPCVRNFLSRARSAKSKAASRFHKGLETAEVNDNCEVAKRNPKTHEPIGADYALSIKS